MIEWKDDYATGVMDIDAQHRVLFKYVNKLEGMLNGTEPKTPPRLSNVLDFLGTYCKNHFAFEEKCMAERNCPVAAQNLAAHKNFMAFFQKSKDRFTQEGISDAFISDIHKAAQDWLIQHICKIDINLRNTKAPGK